MDTHMLAERVYTKTAAGRLEVATRGAGLNARQRAALIMLDGARTARALETAMPAGDVAAVLATLLGLDLIAPAGPHLAPQPAPPSGNAARLPTLKAALIAAADTYLGAMGASVVARINQAMDEAQLLRVLGHWNMAMQESKHGKEAAAALLETTRAALRDPAHVSPAA